MKVNPIVILDFETGGFDAKKNAVTEVGALCIAGDTFIEVGRYSSYIKPYLYEYDQKALDYTGITLTKLQAEGKDLSIVGQELFEHMQMWYKATTNTHTKKIILCGHNVTFDIPFLQQISKESKVDFSKVIDNFKDIHNKDQFEYIDTQRLAMFMWGNDQTQANFKLTTCVEKSGGMLADAHAAMNDVVATKDLLVFFCNKLRSVGSGTGVQVKEAIRYRDNFHFQFPKPV